jgi:ABC-type sulfate transport system permease subunit
VVTVPVFGSKHGSGAVGQGNRAFSSPAVAGARTTPIGTSTAHISVPFVAREILPTVATISSSAE